MLGSLIARLVSRVSSLAMDSRGYSVEIGWNGERAAPSEERIGFERSSGGEEVDGLS